jgi:hypothetical protein
MGRNWCWKQEEEDSLVFKLVLNVYQSMELQIFICLMTAVIVRLSNENCNHIDLQDLEIKIVLLLGM